MGFGIIDLHLGDRSGVARVDTDHRQAKLFDVCFNDTSSPT
jgi:hypothetical protein